MSTQKRQIPRGEEQRRIEQRNEINRATTMRKRNMVDSMHSIWKLFYSFFILFFLLRQSGMGEQNKITYPSGCLQVCVRCACTFLFIQTEMRKDIFYTASKMNKKMKSARQKKNSKHTHTHTNRRDRMVGKQCVLFYFSMRSKMRKRKAQSTTELLKMKDYFVCERAHNKRMVSGDHAFASKSEKPF